jgi:hypothetical protein
MFLVATGHAPQIDTPSKWCVFPFHRDDSPHFFFFLYLSRSTEMNDFLSLCLTHEQEKRPRAAVLQRHKWILRTPCTQTDMAMQLRDIFYARDFKEF